MKQVGLSSIVKRRLPLGLMDHGYQYSASYSDNNLGLAFVGYICCYELKLELSLNGS